MRLYCAVEGTEEGTFGAMLRCLRRAAELPQEELAERARVSARGLRDLERGASRATYHSTAFEIADALCLPPDELFAFVRTTQRSNRELPTRSMLPVLLNATGQRLPGLAYREGAGSEQTQAERQH